MSEIDENVIDYASDTASGCFESRSYDLAVHVKGREGRGGQGTSNNRLWSPWPTA